MTIHRQVILTGPDFAALQAEAEREAVTAEAAGWTMPRAETGRQGKLRRIVMTFQREDDE